jgi:hypothetical protein
MGALEIERPNIDLLRELDILEVPRRHELYDIELSLDAREDDALAHEAQRMHGASYVDYGYFKPEALDVDGRLFPELDGTRAKQDGNIRVDYILARSNHTGEAGASVRLIRIGESANIESLPTYKYFKDAFDDVTKAKLRKIIDENGTNGLGEIAALSNAGHDHSVGSYEIMRAIVQNTVIQHARRGHSEVYLASLTNKSLKPVRSFTGPSALRVIGEPVRIFADDARAHEIHVTPVLIEPYKIVATMADRVRGDGTEINSRFVPSLLFMLEGLTPEQMGPDFAALVEQVTQL